MLLRNYNEPLEFIFSGSLTDIPGLALPTLQYIVRVDDVKSPVKNAVAFHKMRSMVFS